MVNKIQDKKFKNISEVSLVNALNPLNSAWKIIQGIDWQYDDGVVN